MQFRILFIVLFTAFVSNAQSPAYYFFGQEQFKGIDIYDVIQDTENNYWFATGGGLYFYNGYTYESIECPEMKSASVFGFCKDSKGIIYCHNLHHQFFRIIDRKMELYFELDEKSRSPNTTMIIDHDDNLIIQGRNLTIVSPDKKKVITVEDPKIHTYGSIAHIYLSPTGGTMASSTFPMIVTQKDGVITYHDCREDIGITEFSGARAIPWVVSNKRLIGINTENFDAYEFDPYKNKLKFLKKLTHGPSKHNLRIYATENRLWIVGASNGVYVYDSDLNPLFGGKPIYNDHYISDICTDHENNILLSTFDEGVIIIPNNSVQSIQLPGNRKTSKITSFNSSIIIGTNTGDIYSFNATEGLKFISSDKNHRSIESIHYWKSKNAIVNTVIRGAQIIDLTSSKLQELITGSLKDAYFIDKNTAIFALNQGVHYLEFDPKNGSLSSRKSIFNGRTFTVTYDPSTKTCYAGTSAGFMLIYEDGTQYTESRNGETVLAATLFKAKDKVYVGTRKHGILVYTNDQLVEEIPFKESIRKIVIYNDQIYALTRSGLYVSKKKSTQFLKLNKSTGLNCDNIVDFCITDNILYLTNSENIQFISLDQLFSVNHQIPIHFSTILVDEKKIESNCLRHDQSNIRFEFEVKTLRYQDNIHYEYKLEGLDDTWHELPYDINFVQFSALGPGKYEFIVRSINGTKQSKPIKYSFTIQAPYYQKWWFYLIIFLITSIIVGGLYSLRIRNIRKKNKERLEKQKIQTDLLETELKALRSQMNPHFIFNSLNSIQDLILKEDTDASYDYIVLFADLVRSALNYSNKDFIPIEKELEFLDVYLSLEKLRFKEDFTYTIQFNGPEEIDVPSMLIQPFIENALLHGLLHKSGKKHLSINFEYDQFLTCTIEDNGIGRKKAAEIGDRQGREHESFALDAIHKRLAIFNARQEEEIGRFTIEDLYPELEETGTRVIISLPFKRHF